MSAIRQMTIDELIQEFEFLGDWEERCDYLIDLGFEVPAFPEEEKTEENRVRGCQSNVWLISKTHENGSVKIEFLADSDAMLVKGLIAVVLLLYSGKSPAEILDTDARPVFARLGLDRHLSTARRNGLSGMVKRIREIASRFTA